MSCGSLNKTRFSPYNSIGFSTTSSIVFKLTAADSFAWKIFLCELYFPFLPYVVALSLTVLIHKQSYFAVG